MQQRAVLLVNLGSPDSPAVKDVRRYLNQFLMDPYVIQLPWALRRLIVGLFVLPTRPRASAEAYRSVWMDEGAPLLVLSRRMLESLRARTPLPVDLAMRYGNPSIEAALLGLARREGVEEVLFVPLYPHYAQSTVKTSVEEARRIIARHGLALRLKVLKPFYEEADYIRALVNSARPYLERRESWDHVVLSYHGLPELHITRADPTGQHCLQRPDCCSRPSPAHATCYRHQVLRTTQRFVEEAGLHPAQYTVTFQSRLGRAKWLEPSTQETLERLAGQGVKRVLVLCPAFVTDCLETLEEIEIRNAETFKAAGGESLTLVPCLNDREEWVEVLRRWIEEPDPRRIEEVR